MIWMLLMRKKAEIMTFIVCLIMLGFYTYGYQRGFNIAATEYELATMRRLKEHEDALRDGLIAAAKRNDEILLIQRQKEREYAEQLRQLREETKDHTKEVVRYVNKTPSAADCRLDADGLRIWNKARKAGITHTSPKNPSK